jgi:hypothetical protein
MRRHASAAFRTGELCRDTSGTSHDHMACTCPLYTCVTFCAHNTFPMRYRGVRRNNVTMQGTANFSPRAVTARQKATNSSAAQTYHESDMYPIFR